MRRRSWSGWPTTIDGLRCEVNVWTADHNGVKWKYVRYVLTSQKPLGTGGLWLNPFLRNAIANHVLSSSNWLTAIDGGFEIPVAAGHASRAGHGMSMTSYVLNGLPVVKR
jgi:hypothetical protein